MVHIRINISNLIETINIRILSDIEINKKEKTRKSKKKFTKK